MKDLVIVKSKTINHEAVPIVFNVVEVMQGEEKDKREISRSFIFEDFQSTIPLVYAKALVKQYPKEFRIAGSVAEVPTRVVEEVLLKEEERSAGFICELCKFEAKNKAGLTAHLRYRHPEKH